MQRGLRIEPLINYFRIAGWSDRRLNDAASLQSIPITDVQQNFFDSQATCLYELENYDRIVFRRYEYSSRTLIPPTNTVTRTTPLNPFTLFITQGYYSLFIADSLVLDVPNSC